MDDDYINQVHMLVELLPYGAKEAFALKGGTAINLFHLDMPRLSADINPTYMPNLPIREFPSYPWHTSDTCPSQPLR